MDFLTAGELALIRGDVTDLTSDVQINATITYRAFQSRTFTPSTGEYTLTYTDTVLGAIRNEVPMSEVVASDGLYERGDLKFIINRPLLPSEPGKEDRILDGSTVYDLVTWDSDPISALWRIVARKVA